MRPKRSPVSRAFECAWALGWFTCALHRLAIGIPKGRSAMLLAAYGVDAQAGCRAAYFLLRAHVILTVAPSAATASEEIQSEQRSATAMPSESSAECPTGCVSR